MGRIVYPVSPDKIPQFINHLRELREKGWEAKYTKDGKIRLRKESGRPYCPLTATCLEVHSVDLDYYEDTIKAGEMLGFTGKEALGLAGAADNGVSFDDVGGMRYCHEWGFPKPLRYAIENALGLIPWYGFWRRLRARSVGA